MVGSASWRPALQLVIREGPQSVNIKRVAKELGSSTAPISWTFGSMESFRNELAKYALDYFNGRIAAGQGGKNPVAAFAFSSLPSPCYFCFSLELKAVLS